LRGQGFDLTLDAKAIANYVGEFVEQLRQTAANFPLH
jgi:hypothetical protein